MNFALNRTTALRWSATLLGLLLSITAAGCGDGDSSPTLDPEQDTLEITEVGPDRYAVHTDIVIEASPEQVWQVLTDFDAMPTWSSNLQGIDGELEDGASVEARFLLQGMPFSFPHTLVFLPDEEFGWADPVLLAPGISDRHRYIVGESDGQLTLFIQSDEFLGTSEAFTAEQLAELAAPGYQTFNQELKAEVERRSSGTQ